MSTSVPDGISFSDLQALAKQAPEEASVPTGPYAGMDQDELLKLVDDIVDEAHQKCAHPMIAKLLIVEIASRLLGWHTKSGLDVAEDGDSKTAMYWLRDAGKLQAVMCLMDGISMGPDDFTFTE